MSAITLVRATVKYPAGKTLETRHGQRINVVLTLPDGTEYKEWSHPDDRFLRSLKKGDTVQVVKDGDRYKLLKMEDETVEPKNQGEYRVPGEPSPTPHTPHPTPQLGTPAGATRWSKECKQRIAEEARQRAALIGFCHAQVREQFTTPEGDLLVSEEAVQKYGTMLYLDIKELWR
ncbi:MAG: hypothetical protein ONB55_22575 [candidate division KSB1 bacterium]|nr:hypothetical protein [candidate division KSB1 bacterium]